MRLGHVIVSRAMRHHAAMRSASGRALSRKASIWMYHFLHLGSRLWDVTATHFGQSVGHHLARAMRVICFESRKAMRDEKGRDCTAQGCHCPPRFFGDMVHVCMCVWVCEWVCHCGWCKRALGQVTW